MSEHPSAPSQIEPLTVSVDDVIRLTGLSRATIYGLMADRKLLTSKVGRRQLVHYSSVKTLLANTVAA